MTIDGETAYAYARKPGYYIGHIKGFERHLFAASLQPKQVKVEPGPLEPRTHNSFTRVMRRYAPEGIAMKWSEDIPVLVKGMTVAGGKLVVAGPSFELHPSSFLVDPATNRIRLDYGPGRRVRVRRCDRESTQRSDRRRETPACSCWRRQRAVKRPTSRYPAVPCSTASSPHPAAFTSAAKMASFPALGRALVRNPR